MSNIHYLMSGTRSEVVRKQAQEFNRIRSILRDAWSMASTLECAFRLADSLYPDRDPMLVDFLRVNLPTEVRPSVYMDAEDALTELAFAVCGDDEESDITSDVLSGGFIGSSSAVAS